MHPDLEPRLRAEEYFARSGRTFRKGRARIWFDEEVKPVLVRTGLQLSGLYGRGLRNALDLRVRQVEFGLPRLPRSFDGFSILQISDTHIDKIDGLAERLAEAIQALRPDLCVLTGDYRYAVTGSCERVYPRMKTILDAVAARHGTLGILGNHDAAEMVERFSAMGVRMLVNECFLLEKDGAQLCVAGVDDRFDYRADDLGKALRGFPEEAFKVLLAHSPCLYKEAAERHIDLYLCGHTHAGQIRLPGVGAIRKNGPFPRAFAQGKWVYNDMHAYTSWGAGCSTLPVRFNCPPEVALIELRTG